MSLLFVIYHVPYFNNGEQLIKIYETSNDSKLEYFRRNETISCREMTSPPQAGTTISTIIFMLIKLKKCESGTWKKMPLSQMIHFIF